MIKVCTKVGVMLLQKNTYSTYNAAVVGANGYSGIELVRLLQQHPSIANLVCYTRDPNWHIQDELRLPANHRVSCLPLSSLMDNVNQFHSVFLATPASVSMTLAPALLKQNVNVIDLSGAFRLTEEDFQHWYQESHTASAYLGRAQYGLAPWQPSYYAAYPQLITNPGCYATAILMGLLPLLKHKLIDEKQIVIDAKSGVSGAGKSMKPALHFCEIEGNCLPYKVGVHQHLPEIIRYAKLFSGALIKPMLSTHLLPVKRGILASIYSNIHSDYLSLPYTTKMTLIEKALADAYADYPLVSYCALQNQSQDKQVLALTEVVGTGRTHIGYYLNEDQLYLYVTIDNLLKGAASQALENFNGFLGLPLTTAILTEESIS